MSMRGEPLAFALLKWHDVKLSPKYLYGYPQTSTIFNLDQRNFPLKQVTVQRLMADQGAENKRMLSARP